MNVDKMRHQLARTEAAGLPYELARRLAAMTDEHRANHVGPFAFVACTTCVTQGMSRTAVALRRMTAGRVATR